MRIHKHALLYASFLLVFTAGLIYRVANINADPINALHFVEALDEGTYSYAARNFFLYQKWRTDGVNFFTIMPLYPILQYWGVKLFGIHNYSFRLTNLVLSAATPLALFFFLRKELGHKPALASSLVLSINFLYLSFARSGLPVVTMMFFTLITLIAWYYSLTARKYIVQKAFISGILLSATLFIKQSGASLIGVFILSAPLYIVYKGGKITALFQNPRWRKLFIGLASGISLLLLFYLYAVVLPNIDIWPAHYRHIISGNRPRKALLNITYSVKQLRLFLFGVHWLFVPFLFILMGLYIALWKEKIQNWRKNASFVEILFALEIALFFLLFLLSPNKYARFFVPAVLPMSVVAGALFSEANKKYVKKLLGRWSFPILYFLIIGCITVNTLLGYRYFIQRASFSYLNGAKQLEKIVKRGEWGRFPETWIMNTPLKNLNTFYVEMEDEALKQYFDQYGTPDYFMIIDFQIKDYKKKTPQFFKTLKKIKNIENYALYRIKK